MPNSLNDAKTSLNLGFKVFLDLDDTLIHAMYKQFSSKRVRVDFPDTVDHRGKPCPEWYGVIEKPGTQKFIDSLREVFGYDNVYILTAATEDYAQKINEVFGWGFESDHIIGRNTEIVMHLHGNMFDSVLYDNLPEKYPNTDNKMAFLKSHGKARFVLSQEFSGHETNKFTNEKIHDIIEEICQVIK